MTNKILALDAAVKKYVQDRKVFLYGGFPLNRVPTIFFKEILRQNRAGNVRLRDMLLMSSGPCLGGDLLVSEGLVESFISVFTSHERAGLSKVMRDALEKGIPRKVKWEDESNLTINMKIMAAALNLPFIPSTSGIWGDLRKPGLWDQAIAYTKNIIMEDPYGSGQKVALLQTVKPDISVVHVPFADPKGNGIILGSLNYDYWIGRAGKNIILVADHIVDTDACRRYPNLVTIPGLLVSAVIPWYMGAWPCNSVGLYAEDLQHLSAYIKDSRGETLKAYKEKYVYSWETHDDFMKLIGQDKIKELEASPTTVLAEPFRPWIYSKERVAELLAESE